MSWYKASAAFYSGRQRSDPAERDEKVAYVDLWIGVPLREGAISCKRVS